jgi:hypothetical protein
MSKRRARNPRAIVSGQAGIVVMDAPNGCSYRRMGETDFRGCRPQDVSLLLGDATDVLVISGKSPTQISRILENEWANDRALHLLLILVDGESHLRAKRIAVESLDDLLSNPPVMQFVNHRLYARTLPPTADLDEAVRMSNSLIRKTVWNMLVELRRHQPNVKSVRERWALIDPRLFNDALGKSEFEQIAIEEGMFFKLCVDRASSEDVAAWADGLRLRGFSSRREVLDAWTAPFRIQKKTVAKETQGSFNEVWERHNE